MKNLEVLHFPTHWAARPGSQNHCFSRELATFSLYLPTPSVSFCAGQNTTAELEAQLNLIVNTNNS